MSRSTPPSSPAAANSGDVRPYGDLLEFNTSREVLDAVGKDVLTAIAQDYLELLGTSSAVYETNGDYALGIFTSGWCRFMDAASHALCGTPDPQEALACGRWHCHESCWTASHDSMRMRTEMDVACEGGIRLYAVPIIAGDQVVGSINFGYGDPPRDPGRLAELAARYGVSVEELQEQAAAYEPRPAHIVEMAKRRLRASAKLIGEIVARRRAEEALRERNRELEAEIARREVAEAAQRETTETLAGLVSAIPLAVIGLDLQGLVRSWNRAAERIFGWSEPDVMGLFNPVVPPDKVEEAQALLEAARVGRLSAGFETERQRRDGSRVPVSLSTAPLLDAGGVTVGVILLLEDITERTRIEAALQQSEQSFRLLADALPQQIWVTRPDGYHEYYNQRWYDYTGLTLEETEGEGWNAVLHPDDQQRAWERWRRSLATGEPYEIEYRFRRHDGEYRWFLGQALPQRDQEGGIVRWFGTLTDVHERFEAAAERERLLEAVVRSEERYALVSRATNDVIWDWDVAANELVWNEALETTFGYALTDVPPRIEFWYDHIHPDDRERVVHSIHQAIDGGLTSWSAEYRFTRANGAHAVVFDRGVIARDEAGRATRMIGSMLDISERERLLASERHSREAAEHSAAALAERESEFRAMADNIPQLAWMADAEGWIYWYNRRWFDYTGTTLEEMQGWGWQKVHHPDHVDRVVQSIRHSWDTGVPWEDLFPLRSREGEWRWFLSRAEPIRDERGQVIRWFGTNTDVTERRAAESERERLLQAERDARAEAEFANQAKMDFLSAMSHELRTPLNAIGGYIDLLDMGIHGPITSTQQAALARVRTNQQHLLTLINDVLAFAKLDAGRVEFHIRPLDVRDVLFGVEPLVAPQAEAKGIALSIQECDPELRLLGDDERVRQILLNLVGNAVKFTPEGGWVALSCDADEGAVSIYVRDSGPGIPTEKQKKIFDPFVQVDRRLNQPQEGIGLGLSISRDLAEGMDGALGVESEPGTGTTFTLRLPRARTSDLATLADT